ncbi:MAG: PAS domain S-box protein [Trueperaceae bacterium]|nr:MAG: PAS domain S-box protein [Trueperaceae bacterium]
MPCERSVGPSPTTWATSTPRGTRVPEAQVFTGLLLNGALLVALSLAAGIVPWGRDAVGRRWPRQLLIGAVVAAFGVAVMLMPVVLTPGLAFDVRSVLLSLSGLFFGAVPTAIAMAATAVLRWGQGGVGMWPGIGVIVASGVIGLAWRWWRSGRLRRIGPLELYALGIVVHVAMLAILLGGLPQPARAAFWSEAALPVLLFYPLLTVLVGRLMVMQADNAWTLERLRASEERFRTLFENSHAIMLIVDPSDGSIVDANAAAVAFYGYGGDELRAIRIDQITTRTPEETHGAMARAMSAGPTSFDSKHRLADGSIREVEMISGPIDLDERSLLYSLVIDAQERREAEEVRREGIERQARAGAEEAERQRRARLAALNLAQDALLSQRELAGVLSRLKVLIEHAPVALAMFDRELRFTAVSRRFLMDYGLEDVEVIGRHHYDVFPEIPERFREAHRRALAGEALRADEDELVRHDGTVMWQRWEVRPWYGEDGAIGGMVLFTEDITDMVRARQQLEKLSAAVEQSPESIVITNLDGEIEYVNDAFVAATGYTRDEVLGRNPRVLNSGKTPSSTYREMWDALTSGRTWKGEFVNRRKDGSEYVEFATVSAITGSDGTPTHYIAVKEDVTEKKRMGRELDRYRYELEALVAERTLELEAARERAEAANRAKSTFLANMSHEIRTPLNAVVGLTHLLQLDDTTPRQRDRLAKIDGAAGHLLAIISDVLDIAKIEAGRASLDVRDFHLSAVLDQVRSMIAGAAAAKGLTVEVDEDHVPQWLRGDPTRLRQALLNLAANAVKFTDTGTVWLRSNLIEQSGTTLRVRFEVEDTGIGIAPEALGRLFTPFEQADASVTRRYGGAGLGLAITKELAEMMGGEAGVESTVGVGTLVWFTAELEVGRGVMPSGDIEAPGDGAGDGDGIVTWRRFAGSRVLVAEDHPINREVAVELLYGFGLDVESVGDGREAVERARHSRFDVVLMDVQMPVMDGFEATRAIRSLPGYAGVPIIAMSANVFDEDRRACLDAGMSDFVAKPIDRQALAATLARWLEQREWAASVGRMARPGGEPLAPADRATTGLAWPGLDVDTGLEAVGGDPQRYGELLRRFARAHARDARQLRIELERGDREAARQRLHALGGVASMLGVTLVHDAATSLQRVLRAGGDVPADLIDALEAALEGFVAAVPSLLDAAASPPPEAAALLPADAALERLAALLEADDPDAGAWLSSQLAGVRQAFGDEADRLADAVERFDYAAAREVVARLRSRR